MFAFNYLWGNPILKIFANYYAFYIPLLYLYYIQMKFEFDPIKSNSNLIKHGIDFNQAKQLWKDIYLLELPAKNLNEVRVLYIGIIKNKHWSAITTIRNSKIRIISVRRARANEIKLYRAKPLGN